jgi:hypothetical protein
LVDFACLKIGIWGMQGKQILASLTSYSKICKMLIKPNKVDTEY